MATVELRNLATGTWRGIICDGYNPDGTQKRVRRTIKVNPNSNEASQRKQAQRQADALETDYRRHLITEANKIRLSEVAEEYLEHHQMAESTKAWYRGLLNGRILPAMGKLYVQDITPRHIRDFYKKLSTDEAFSSRSKTGKLSGTYRLHYHRALAAVMQFAVKSGYITVSPMAAIDPPRKDTQEAEFLEEKDIAELLTVLDSLDEPLWRAFFTLGLYSSARPGELIGLNWNDLEGNTLHIRAGSVYIKGKGTVRTAQPKNKSSIRSVVLPPVVITVLNSWKADQSAKRLKVGNCWPEPEAMFTGEEGHRLNINTPTQKWRKIQKQYGLKDVNLYSLRHTGASLLIAAGCDVKEVSDRLGHSRASTTLDTYTHLFEKAAQHTADVLTAAIDAARAKAT